MHRIGSILLLTSIMLLSACSTLTPKIGQEALQDQLDGLHSWQVRGKLSVVTPDDNVTGYLTWQQQRRQYDLFISGPFGTSASRLQGDHRSASLTLPGWKKPRQARTPEHLMLEHLGWNFPVSDIRYWVKGQPSPNGTVQTEYDEHGLLQRLQQHGWEVRYSRYRQQGDYWLPGLIRISGNDFRFTFAIQEWNING